MCLHSLLAAQVRLLLTCGIHYTAAPVCEVTVRAISAEMITCEAECSNTMRIKFSSNIPENNNLQTCGGMSTSSTISGSSGTCGPCKMFDSLTTHGL